jgi:hypothetical protein
MLKFDPQKRPTAQQILHHPFFSGHNPIQRPITPQIIEGFPKPAGMFYLDKDQLNPDYQDDDIFKV